MSMTDDPGMIGEIARAELQALNPYDKNGKAIMWELTDDFLFPEKRYKYNDKAKVRYEIPGFYKSVA